MKDTDKVTLTFGQLKKLINEAYEISHDFDKNEVLKSLKPHKQCNHQPSYEQNSVGDVRIYCPYCMKPLQRKFFPTLKIAANFYNNDMSENEFVSSRYYFPKRHN